MKETEVNERLRLIILCIALSAIFGAKFLFLIGLL